MADADFLFGVWAILKEDRGAQKRGEPYWTLMPQDYYGGGIVLTRGPIGRKAMDTDAIIWAEGYETDGLGCSEEDQKMILAALNRKD